MNEHQYSNEPYLWFLMQCQMSWFMTRGLHDSNSDLATDFLKSVDELDIDEFMIQIIEL